MLKIKDLTVHMAGAAETAPVLQELSLEMPDGAIHALMGKNGSGKSTLAHVIMGSPFYTVASGGINFCGTELVSMSPQERAALGIFLSFQHPNEIEGVRVSSYLRTIYNISRKEKLSPVKFRKHLAPLLVTLDMEKEFLGRYLNEGFSGGEKKKLEMLQMLLLEPKLVVLDEVDSGLDVDALRVISKAIVALQEKTNATVLVITHYCRILKYIVPEKVLIMEAGKLVKEGGKELAFEIEETGYGEIPSQS
jgi:Fe-S cluster assembly ATP-binding protein